MGKVDSRATTQIFASVEEKAMIRLHVIVKNYNARALVFDSRILKMHLQISMLRERRII